MTEPYNPLDKLNLGNSVANALLQQPLQCIESLKRFEGAGVYALYYSGDFSQYAPIVTSDSSDSHIQQPIYVGKAVPKGARRGNPDRAASDTSLYRRLNDHKKSLDQASNLLVENFYFRHLIVDDIWIPLAETRMIAQYQPLWNQTLDGFGNHDPGAGRSKGQIPPWDMVHPGRSWAEKLEPNRKHTKESLLQEISRILAENSTFD